MYYYRDKNNNVLIKKSGNKKDNKTLILQAHLDMVCVKTKDSNHDFSIDPIEIIIQNDIVTAKDTSLGADQGIGIAMMMLILESKNIKHPDLECLFTSEEETTFNGVCNFDFSILDGKRLINLDHDRDDSIIIGGDGDIYNQYIFKYELIYNTINTYKISLSVPYNGNSGVEIEKSKENAITKMALYLKEISKNDNIYICKIDGGTSEIDIATECECIVKSNLDISKYFIINNDEEKFSVQKLNSDEDLKSFSFENTKKLLDLVLLLDQGNITNITSGNVGMIKTNNNEIILSHILRSINTSELEECNNKNTNLAKEKGFKIKEVYRDDSWIPSNNSELLQSYSKVFFKVNKEYPNKMINHGGLECSAINKRIDNLDMISIGSKITGCHTVNEKFYISSCKKTLKTLLRFLEDD